MKVKDKKLIEPLVAMIARIMDTQKKQNLNDTDLLRKYPDIGSPKGWRDRLIPQKWDEISLENHHRKLKRVCDILDGGSPDEFFDPLLPFAREVIRRVELLERQQKDRRILMVLAPSGTGKSATARHCVAQEADTRVMVRIRPSWRNSQKNLTFGILQELGTEPSGLDRAQLEGLLELQLKTKPRTVFLDQAHEGGIVLMHMLRSLVEMTKSRFVYLAYDTTYNAVMKASSDAANEAQAFMGRCLKPPFNSYAAGTSAEDVSYLIGKYTDLDTAESAELANSILPILQRMHNLRLLEDAIERAEQDGIETLKPDTTIQDQIIFYTCTLANMAPPKKIHKPKTA